MIALTCGAAAWTVASMTAKIDQRDHPLKREEFYPVQLAAFRAAFPATKQIVLGTPTYQGPGLYYRYVFAHRGLAIELQRPGTLRLQPGTLS